MVSLREEILHVAADRVYDPSARRERYLRERKLKGRAPANFDPPGSESTANSSPHHPGPPGNPVTPERVAAMKVRLAQLKELLAKLVEEAKAKAGVETKEKTDSAKTAETKKPEKKTAAEKKKDAKAQKEKRDKEPPKPETASSIQAQIDSVRKQIEDMRAKLAAARKAAPKKKPTNDSQFVPSADKNPPVKQPTALDGRHH